MDQTKFLEGMARLTANFPGQIDDERAKLRAATYFEALHDLSDEEWKTAVRRAIREEKFFPPVARLVELAGPSDVAARSAAADAFAKIIGMPREITRYQPEGGDRLVPQKIREVLGPVAYQAFRVAGGRQAFEDCADKDRPFLLTRFEKEFLAASAELRRTGELPAAAELKRLPGPVHELAAATLRDFPQETKA